MIMMIVIIVRNSNNNNNNDNNNNIKITFKAFKISVFYCLICKLVTLLSPLQSWLLQLRIREVKHATATRRKLFSYLTCLCSHYHICIVVNLFNIRDDLV